MPDVGPMPDHGPRWGTLYAVVAALLALLGLLDVAVRAATARRAVEGVGILVLFGAMTVWIRCNRTALAQGQGRMAGEPSRPVVVRPRCPRCGATLAANGAGGERK